MKESSTSAWGSVLLALSYFFVLCVSAGAESTKEIVDKVLTGPDAEKDAASRTFQESSSDEAAGLFLKAYMEGDKKAQGNALLGLSSLSMKSDAVTETYLTIACSGRETLRSRNRRAFMGQDGTSRSGGSGKGDNREIRVSD